MHVPDPGLAPLLACHFSARVLAETSLGLERAGLIRSLLPVALANATAFDTVLAYLLIATDPEDVTVLDGVVAQLGAPVLPAPTRRRRRGRPAFPPEPDLTAELAELAETLLLRRVLRASAVQRERRSLDHRNVRPTLT